MGGLPLPSVGKSSGGGPARPGPGESGSAPGGFGPKPTVRMAIGRRGSGGNDPRSSLLLGVWGALALGVAGVAWGAVTWSEQTFVTPLHIGAAVISFFGSVVILALLRRDLNQRRSSGRLVERRLTSIRTTTTVALLAWSCGILHLGLVALELSSGLGG